MKKQLGLLFGLCLILISCEGNKEQDDLALAQKCLNEVKVPADADACFNYVAKYNSQQANILKCSILMTSGGLLEKQVIKAYEALEDSNITNKEAAYMAVLSLTEPDLNTALQKAVEANMYCKKTNVPGLMYFSNIIMIGTQFNKGIEAITGDILDIDDPASIENAVNDFINNCGSNPQNCFQPEEVEMIGEAVLEVADSYCSNESASEDVCQKINDAVNAAGINSENVGEALLCFLSGKTFSNGTCN